MSISSKKLKFSVSVEVFKDLFHIPIELVEYFDRVNREAILTFL